MPTGRLCPARWCDVPARGRTGRSGDVDGVGPQPSRSPRASGAAEPGGGSVAVRPDADVGVGH